MKIYELNNQRIWLLWALLDLIGLASLFILGNALMAYFCFGMGSGWLLFAMFLDFGWVRGYKKTK